MKKRSEARRVSLEILYWLTINKISPKKALSDFFSLYPKNNEFYEFASYIVLGVCKNKVKIDKILKKYLQNWEIERLAVIDHIIFQIAIFELLFGKDAPPVVIIDEAIELSKRFSTADSFRIINGVLDRIKNEIKS